MPKPPYLAVVFTSELNESAPNYESLASQMVQLAKQQPGFLGIESAREELGITVSYWKDEAAVLNWSKNIEHQKAKQLGKEKFYKSYTIRICKVDRVYSFKGE